MQETTFIDKCLKGEASLDEIDDYIDAWHDGITPEDIELHTYLGMTWDEYSLWVRDSSVLESIINKKTNDLNKISHCLEQAYKK